MWVSIQMPFRNPSRIPQDVGEGERVDGILSHSPIEERRDREAKEGLKPLKPTFLNVRPLEDSDCFVMMVI